MQGSISTIRSPIRAHGLLTLGVVLMRNMGFRAKANYKKFFGLLAGSEFLQSVFEKHGDPEFARTRDTIYDLLDINFNFSSNVTPKHANFKWAPANSTLLVGPMIGKRLMSCKF